MKKYKFLIALLALVAGVVTAGSTKAAIQHYRQSTVPTIFVHGWGSSANAEDKMARAAQQAGVTKTIVRANVSRQGTVIFNRDIPKGAINPIVEVNLADNKLSHYRNNYVQGYHHGGTYVKNVVNAVEKQGHFPAINLVGHSMGNIEIANYINDNAGHLPKINHLVAIAGHYNGLVGQSTAESKVNSQTGQPAREDPTFKELLSLRQNFPTNTRVLNIYGDLDNGSHSDGDVPVNSAKSLKYLVGTRAKSYRELPLHGRSAQHSRLHNNNHQVDQALINFLWTK
ncbi:alpha/beta hydrolase [Limosilactobacillus sp.]|uniref:alpha/beta hydrolase n=1 Tax=Limosilactobacillus sp. TaxID=2773925 RepID=UPI003EFE9F35